MSSPSQGPAETHEREAGRNRRAENLVLLALAGAALAAVGFAVLFIALPDTQLLGLALAASLALLGVAAVVAARKVAPREVAVEERVDFGEQRSEGGAVDMVHEAEVGVSRRRLLLGAAGASGATVGAAALLPATALGPKVGETIARTPWSRGRRVVDSRDRPITADDVHIGTMLTGFPEGASRRDLGASIVLVKEPPEALELPTPRRAIAPEGVLAFSKICTHAACAVGLYRHPLYEPTTQRPALICPCHYSSFDVRRGGRLEFGPAGRDLPQLPLALNAARELVATGGFIGQIGPSYLGVRK